MIRLSPLQCAILVRLSWGESFKWIAATEHTTEEGARQAARRAYVKLGVHNAKEAVAAHPHRGKRTSRACLFSPRSP